MARNPLARLRLAAQDRTDGPEQARDDREDRDVEADVEVGRPGRPEGGSPDAAASEGPLKPPPVDLDDLPPTDDDDGELESRPVDLDLQDSPVGMPDLSEDDPSVLGEDAVSTTGLVDPGQHFSQPQNIDEPGDTTPSSEGDGNAEVVAGDGSINYGELYDESQDQTTTVEDSFQAPDPVEEKDTGDDREDSTERDERERETGSGEADDKGESGEKDSGEREGGSGSDERESDEPGDFGGGAKRSVAVADEPVESGAFGEGADRAPVAEPASMRVEAAISEADEAAVPLEAEAAPAIDLVEESPLEVELEPVELTEIVEEPEDAPEEALDVAE